LIEFLSSCPTNWALTPKQALAWIEQKMVPCYPLGDYKKADIVKHLN
jgi:2-oxoglutarate ferredoxin oxidoreductase subunit beta